MLDPARKMLPSSVIPAVPRPEPGPEHPGDPCGAGTRGLRGPAAPRDPRGSAGGCSRKPNVFGQTRTRWSSSSERFRDILASPNSITAC